ncbi:branched-chain amino acid ABC transporter permease [Halobacteriales archaeon QS_1_68_17]|nr:MAG: branched-chain amino acid ABC transporter permease [Halobacteriales archaeon QS_1_68_17]
MSVRGDYLAGARAVAPVLVGIVPFGLIAGATAVAAGIPPFQAVAMSVIVFAGASQLAAIDLIGRTAPVGVVVLTAVVVNLRLTMYSASIAPYFRGFRAPAKWISAYVLTDQAYALSLTEFRETAPDERSRLWFYLGAATPLWLVWQVATAVGAVLGASVPEGLSLGFAVPLTFLALLFPAIEDRPTAGAALVAGVVAVAGAPLPFNLGLVAAAIAGVAAGTLLEMRAGTFPTTGHVPDDGESA